MSVAQVAHNIISVGGRWESAGRTFEALQRVVRGPSGHVLGRHHVHAPSPAGAPSTHCPARTPLPEPPLALQAAMAAPLALAVPHDAAAAAADEEEEEAPPAEEAPVDEDDALELGDYLF